MSEMIYSLIFTCIYVVLCDFYASVFSGKKRQNGKMVRPMLFDRSGSICYCEDSYDHYIECGCNFCFIQY